MISLLTDCEHTVRSAKRARYS